MLSDVLSALRRHFRVLSETRYEAFGRLRDLTEAPRFTAGTLYSRRALLVSGLAQELYTHVNDCVDPGTPSGPAHLPSRVPGSPSPLPGRLDLVGQDGHAAVWLGADRIDLAPGQYTIPAMAGRGARVSDIVYAEGASLRLDAQPGWVHQVTFRRPFAGPGYLVRLYVDVRFDAAEQAATTCADWSERHGCPLALKYIRDETFAGRRDAMVLYLDRASACLLAPELTALCKHLALASRGRAVTAALPLVAGVSYAEDPVDGGSFVMARCRLLAKALSANDLEDVPLGAALEAACADEDVDAERPWRVPSFGQRPTLCGVAC